MHVAGSVKQLNNGAHAPAKVSRSALRVQAVAATAPPQPKTQTPTPAELGYTMPG